MSTKVVFNGSSGRITQARQYYRCFKGFITKNTSITDDIVSDKGLPILKTKFCISIDIS